MNKKLSDFDSEIVGSGGGGVALKFSSECFPCSVLHCAFFDIIFGWLMIGGHRLSFGC